MSRIELIFDAIKEQKWNITEMNGRRDECSTFRVGHVGQIFDRFLPVMVMFLYDVI